ncbi:MAG: GAF domain-containing protein [Pseudomonadota bacterium]
MFDGPADTIERIVQEAGTHVAAVTVLCTLIFNDKQMILAKSGAPIEPGEAQIQPAEYSLCRFTADGRAKLVIEDAVTHPLVRDSKAVLDHGVAAYLGVPVFVSPDVAAIICAVADQRHAWSKAEVEAIDTAARQAAAVLVTGEYTEQDVLPIVPVHA